MSDNCFLVMAVCVLDDFPLCLCETRSQAEACAEVLKTEDIVSKQVLKIYGSGTGGSLRVKIVEFRLGLPVKSDIVCNFES